MNREEWLTKAGTDLELVILNKTDLIVPPYCVSVGFPKGARGRKKAIGQCWSTEVAQDEKFHIFISPELADPLRVLDVLLHELIHATVGTQEKHKGKFIEVAKACGLKKPWTATTAGEDLLPRLNQISTDLKAYPHGALIPRELEKPPGSRLRLWICRCNVKVRVASDDFLAACGKCGANFERK